MGTQATVDFDALLDEACRPRPHRVDEILAALPDDQVQKVRSALRDRTVGGEAIARALSRMGHKISAGSVRNWRARNL